MMVFSDGSLRSVSCVSLSPLWLSGHMSCVSLFPLKFPLYPSTVLLHYAYVSHVSHISYVNHNSSICISAWACDVLLQLRPYAMASASFGISRCHEVAMRASAGAASPLVVHPSSRWVAHLSSPASSLSSSPPSCSRRYSAHPNDMEPYDHSRFLSPVQPPSDDGSSEFLL